MGRHAYAAPEIDRLVDDAIRQIGAQIDALAIPHLGGVVLGGGYGRGEGGVIQEDGQPPRLSNDLDFYVVTTPDATQAHIAAIAEALAPLSQEWTAKLGVDVDFCPPKTPWRLRHDQERLMIQELIHGYFDVAGRPGEELFREVARRGPEELPWTEAVRLLVNRGAGILLCGEAGRDAGFIARNINKCILGAGDARLIAGKRYRWSARERGEQLQDSLYDRALEWKFRPRREPVCTLETARERWLAAVAEIDKASAGGDRRTLYSALRWLARRRSLGNWRTLGLPPVVRILRAMTGVIRSGGPFPPELKQDWVVFN